MGKQEARRQRVCGHKIRYRSAVEAGEAAERIYQETGAWLRPYRKPCPYCGGGFHLTGCPALSRVGRAA